MRRRAVVAFQADDPGAGEIVLEAQDVADLGAAPGVDRLVVVADAAEVVMALRQRPQPQVLGDVGVLVLVDQDVAELLLVALERPPDARGTGSATCSSRSPKSVALSARSRSW